jgi:tetratricopeptide (TPR) repeat protein
VARDGAARIDLDRLSLPEALTLLADLLGTSRVEAEPAAAAELARACGYLPLALRIAAAHLVNRPRRKLAALLDELRADPMGTLETVDDPQMSVQTVLRRSYQSLTWDNQRAIRLLAGIGWSSFPLEACAAVLGTDVATAWITVDNLTDAHLLEHREDGRFGLHDLVRAYAQSVEDDRGGLLAEGMTRLLGYVQSMSAAAGALITPGQQPPGRRPAPSETRLGSVEQAVDWLERERANIVATVLTHAESQPAIACDIALQLWPYLNGTGRTTDLIQIFERLTRLTEPAHDELTWTAILNALGGAYLKAGRYQESIRIHQQCLRAREAMGDRRGMARSHGNLGLLFERLGQYDESILHYQKTLNLARSNGDRELELQIMSGGITGVYFRIGDYEKTLEILHAGLDLAREHASAFTLIGLWTNLGDTYRRIGDPHRALSYLQESLDLARRARIPGAEAHALGVIADIERDLGGLERAIALRLEANELIAETGLRGEQIDAHLELGHTYVAAGRFQPAHEFFSKALTLAIELGERHQEGRAHLALGRLLIETDTAVATRHLNAAAATLDAISPDAASAARTLLAEVAIRQAPSSATAAGGHR